MTAGLTFFVALLALLGGFGLWWGAWQDAHHRANRLLETTTSQVQSALQRGSSWEEIVQSVREQNSTQQNGEVELWRLDTRGRDVRHFSNRSDSREPLRAPPPPPPGNGAPTGGGAPFPDGNRPPIDAPPPNEALLQGEREQRIPPRADPSGWMTARLPLQSGEIIIGVPWHRAQRGLAVQALTLTLLGIFTTFATAVGAWVLVGRTLTPIEKLAAQARQQAQEQAGHETTIRALVPPSSDREVRELVATFNALLDNVARTARVREQFHTSTSHELRTPLQALSGTLQLALSRPRTSDEYREALQAAAAQSERLNTLTRDLLLLSQLGAGTEMSKCETVKVAEACDLALSGLERPLAAKKLNLEESLLPIEVYAPPSHVEMLTRNLLENAVKYSPPDGTIRVQLSPTQPQVRIWNAVAVASVQSEANFNAWFEPFYRPDAARTSTTGGTGLGLAICKAICEANAWKIELHSQDGGIEVCVWFAAP